MSIFSITGEGSHDQQIDHPYVKKNVQGLKPSKGFQISIFAIHQ